MLASREREPGDASGRRLARVAALCLVFLVCGSLLSAGLLTIGRQVTDLHDQRVLLAELNVTASDYTRFASTCSSAGSAACAADMAAVRRRYRALESGLETPEPPQLGLPSMAASDDELAAWLTGERSVTTALSVTARERALEALDLTLGGALGLVVIVATLLVVLRSNSRTERHAASSVIETTPQSAAGEPARSTDLHRSLLDHCGDLIFVLGADGRVIYQSQSTTALIDISDSVFDAVDPADRRAFAAVLESMLGRSGTQLRHTARWLRRDGGTIWVESVITDLRSDDDIAGVVVNGRDVTDAHRLEEELLQQSFTDALTGLASRAVFTERLGRMFPLRRSDPRTLAVLLFDVDDFYALNETRGHEAGDEVLRRLADILRAYVPRTETVARIGADEFAVLLHTARLAGVYDLASSIHDAIGAAGISVSTGVAEVHGESENPQELLRFAELALHTAIGAGGGQLVRFEEKVYGQALERMALRNGLSAAVQDDQLRVFYQPVVDIGSGALAGVEALVRWQHPTQGLISPLVFIPIAEESGAIVEIGRWVLRTACFQVRRWQQERPRRGRPLMVSVNVSSRQLIDPALVDDVRAALTDSGLNPASLTLEITESQLIEDPANARLVLQRLRGLGVAVAIDDFGTGYSSLSYLEQLPVDTLKIDRSFVQRIAGSEEARVLVRGIVAMAQGLGLRLIAEGVEHRDQADALISLDCQLAQGFYWAQPLPASELETLLTGAQIMTSAAERQSAALPERTSAEDDGSVVVQVVVE